MMGTRERKVEDSLLVAAILVVGGLALVSQQSRAELRLPASWESLGKIDSRVYETGPVGQWDKAVALLARSESDWDEQVQRHEDCLEILPGPVAPRIDWDDQVAVLVSPGSSPYETISVQSLRRHGNRLVVEVRGTYGLPTRAYTPYQILMVERSELGGRTRAAMKVADKLRSAREDLRIEVVYLPAEGSGSGQERRGAYGDAQAASPDAGTQQADRRALTWGGVKDRYR